MLPEEIANAERLARCGKWMIPLRTEFCRRTGREMVNEALNAVLHGSIDDKAALGAPGMWVHDPDEWERVRLEFGEAIEKLRGVPAELH
jgi:hypothetical protein